MIRSFDFPLRTIALAAAVLLLAGCGPNPGGSGDGDGGLDGGETDGQVGDGGCPTGIVCGPLNECCTEGTECVNNMACLPKNVQGGALFPVPDLQVELTATAICPNEVRLAAVVRNEGSAGALPIFSVRFYRTDSNVPNPPELLGTMFPSQPLLPGGWERLVLVYNIPATDVDMTFSVVLDEDGVMEECEEDNNGADSATVNCPGVR